MLNHHLPFKVEYPNFIVLDVTKECDTRHIYEGRW